MTIAAIILAAGASARLGRPKQLLDWGGQPLVRVVAEEALRATFDRVLVVVGGPAQHDVVAALGGLPVQIVANAAAASGQASSLHAGVRALPGGCLAFVVLLCDQPFVTAALLDVLIGSWHTLPAPIIAPGYAGVRGNPVLFAATLAPALLAVQGDQGARAVIGAAPTRVRLVPRTDLREQEDIDTLAAYEQLRP